MTASAIAAPPTAAPITTAALMMTDVVKEYPGEKAVRALDGVSLRVDHGELAALVGPSGSGKSTLLHVVGTLDRPTSGVVEIDGHDTSDMSDKQLSAVRAHAIGFVFQQFFLLDGVSAEANVAEGLMYTGTSRKDRRNRAIEALEMVGLGHRLDHTPGQLSGGEKQRVAIARALVGRPAIVLADEPTGALDTKNSESIVELLFELNRSGSTIVVITHDRELAALLPRQIAFRDGRIESDSRVNAASPDSTGSASLVTASTTGGIAPFPPVLPFARARLHVTTRMSDAPGTAPSPPASAKAVDCNGEVAEIVSRWPL
jgi:putative ABC transport system ATP-binding protein